MDKPIDFEAALAEEQSLGGLPPKGEALGLAFSGGGIRSATFNLGVVQALAALKLLRRFDYLSTISGGGYIGAWLSLFIKRHAGGDAAKAEALLVGRDERGLEHPAIRFLRAFSNYLTPRVGLSKDTLVALATYLRNLLLNLTILVALLGALLILPRVAALFADRLQPWQRLDNWYDTLILALLLVPTVLVALNLLYRPPEKDVNRPWFMRTWVLRGLIDLPVLVAALVTTAFYLQLVDKTIETWPWFRSVILSYFLVWLVGVPIAAAFSPAARAQAKAMVTQHSAKWTVAFIAFAALAGTAGAALFLVIAKAIIAVPEAHRFWVGVTFGPPAVIGAIMLMVVAHIGLMSRRFGEPDRELWSVFGARLMALASCWMFLFGVAFYGAAAIRFANEWVVGLGGAAWVLSTLFGVFAGRSKATGAPESGGGLELLTRLAPYAFVAGLLLALSWGVHRTLERAPGQRQAVALAAGAPVAPPSGVYLRTDRTPGSPVVTVSDYQPPSQWTQFAIVAAEETASIKRWFEPALALPTMALVAFLAALLLSWRVNINVFSLHHFYRNRLARCYLGATSKDRRPHPLSGFDENDDVGLSELAGQRPLHIVGAAINLNRGRQLAWQNRRAASFTFTPLRAGYQPASSQVGGGYRPAGQYGKDTEGQAIMLGTTVAISGAAASPNMGYHTSPAVAFLLTVFNVRLGHWCGDTREESGDAWRRRDPWLGLRYWCAELAGSADQDYPFVSLSDGGHFENLGIYELVRRRCALIVASDAGADPQYAFEDLAEAIRKCYTDFGVRIEFAGSGVDAIRPDRKRVSAQHHAVAKIVYPNGAPAGTLLYWKASIGADMPADIMHYKRTMHDFPHQSTADQFFDESQFESYRNLGYEVAQRSIGAMATAGQLPAQLL